MSSRTLPSSRNDSIVSRTTLRRMSEEYLLRNPTHRSCKKRELIRLGTYLLPLNVPDTSYRGSSSFQIPSVDASNWTHFAARSHQTSVWKLNKVITSMKTLPMQARRHSVFRVLAVMMTGDEGLVIDQKETGFRNDQLDYAA